MLPGGSSVDTPQIEVRTTLVDSRHHAQYITRRDVNSRIVSTHATLPRVNVTSFQIKETSMVELITVSRAVRR